MQRLPCGAVAERLDARAQYRERRTQLVRGVGGELPLHPKAVLEAVERLVDGGDERHDLARNLLRRQAEVPARRADIGRLLGGRSSRRSMAAKDDDVDAEQDQQDRNGDPSDPPEEVRYDVVDDDVAVREVLRDANAYHLAVDGAGDSSPGNRFGERRWRGRRSAGLAPRRKQQIPPGIANVVLVAAIGF